MRRGWIMPFVCLLGFIFLYAPIALIVGLSFLTDGCGHRCHRE